MNNFPSPSVSSLVANPNVIRRFPSSFCSKPIYHRPVRFKYRNFDFNFCTGQWVKFGYGMPLKVIVHHGNIYLLHRSPFESLPDYLLRFKFACESISKAFDGDFDHLSKSSFFQPRLTY